jgi:hypothetical protein
MGYSNGVMGVITPPPPPRKLKKKVINYDKHECDFNTHKSDVYTQSAI